MQPPDLRPITEADLPRLAELEEELFAPDSWSTGMYREELRSADRTYLGLEIDGVLVAWGGVLRAPAAEILTIGVAPAFRRQGYATLIMRELLDSARQAGATEVFLEVRADDPGAQALYQNLGFAPVGIRRNYYPMSGKDAVVMRLALESDN